MIPLSCGSSPAASCRGARSPALLLYCTLPGMQAGAQEGCGVRVQFSTSGSSRANFMGEPLHIHRKPVLRRAILCSCHLEFFIFEKEVWRLNFALGPTNYGNSLESHFHNIYLLSKPTILFLIMAPLSSPLPELEITHPLHPTLPHHTKSCQAPSVLFQPCIYSFLSIPNVAALLLSLSPRFLKFIYFSLFQSIVHLQHRLDFRCTAK